MSGGVFVSYRKADDPGWAGRVRDALARRFGDDHVFFDVDSIRGGQRWEDALDSALTESDAVVLVIGPRWLACLHERQAQPDVDYHLREITMALDRGIPIYPVRVHKAPMPELDDLPAELRDRLPAIQWTEVFDTLFAASMDKVCDDLDALMGTTTSAPRAAPPRRATPRRAGAPPGAKQEVTVGPFGSGADFTEIARAVEAVADGGRVRVRPGRYLEQVVLDRPVAIVGEGKGEAILDADASPAIRSQTDDAVVRALTVKTSTETGAIGIEACGGDLALEGVKVEGGAVPASIGIHATGPATRLVVGGASVASVAVGIRVADGAGARIERTSVTRATAHALVITGGADPKVSDCTFEPAGSATVLVDEGGRGTISGCALGIGDAPTIEVASGGAPTIRGLRAEAPVGVGGGAAAVAGRLVKGVVDRSDDVAGWTVVVRDGGGGHVSLADLAELRLASGGDPMVEACTVAAVIGRDDGAGSLERCRIGEVRLEGGARVHLGEGCEIQPARGVKVSVTVASGAEARFVGCEVVGRNVRDGSADPAVHVTGGRALLERTVVRNPGDGALWIDGGGSAEVVGGEVRATVSGAAVVVDDGQVTVRAGAALRGGVRVGSAGVLEAEGAVLDADALGGGVVDVGAGGRLTMVRTEVRGPGFAAARKVGRWIEAQGSKVRGGKGPRIGGTAAPVRAAAGAAVRLERCELVNVGAEGVDLPDEGVELVGCTLEGDPFP